MAKISLNKILTKKVKDSVKITIQDTEIDVIQYLPIDKKATFINDIMQSAIDTNNIFSPIRLKVYFDLNIIKYYTNFNLTQAMYDEPSKTYDLLMVNEIMPKVLAVIPEEELKFVKSALDACVNDIVTYNNSAAGVIKQITTDYNATNMDVDKLVSELGDPEQFKLVKDVLEKLG